MVVITDTLLHPTKAGLFYVGTKPTRDVSEICDGENF